MTIINVAGKAIAQQSERLEASAKRLARINGPREEGEQPTSIVREAVERIDSEALTKANIAVIKSEQERTNAILDILA